MTTLSPFRGGKSFVSLSPFAFASEIKNRRGVGSRGVVVEVIMPKDTPALKRMLVELANRMSEKAKKRGAPVTTNPLSPGDRRIIHMTLKKDAELTTWSKGTGTLKKVIIAPRQSNQA